MPIDETKPISAAPPQSEGAAQQNAAIAAEHERETFLVDERADPVRQLSAVIGNPRSVAKTGRGIRFRRIAQTRDGPGVLSLHSSRQPVRPQCLRQPPHSRLMTLTWWTQPEVGGRVEEDNRFSISFPVHFLPEA